MPISTDAAETTRAAPGDATTAIAAVSAGPAMKSSSLTTESSAKAPWMSSGRPRSSRG